MLRAYDRNQKKFIRQETFLQNRLKADQQVVIRILDSGDFWIACPNCEDEQFNKLPCASSIQPDFKEGDTFKMVYDLEEPFEIEIQVEKVDDIEEESSVINGRGFAIWDGFKEFQDYYYQSMELFEKYVKANDMNLSDFPVDEDLDIIELNKVLEDNFEELKDVYEGE